MINETILSPPSEKQLFWQGVKDCIPTLLGYIGIGGAFGIVGSASNFSMLEIILLSIFVYAGSAQFIICALLVAHTPLSVVVFTTFIVNLRHFLMGLTVAPAFKSYSIWRNIGIGTLLTDETFGVASTKLMSQHRLQASWMNGLNITAYLCWIISSIAGACLGQWINNPEMLGLDFALTAMFVALLILQLQQVASNKLKPMLLVVGYTILFMFILMLFLPSHFAVIIATILAATIGVLTER
ncbi:AzlC family ABC transporter permease [Paenibacillus endoradicis]|uniref:AzlC family ABC transporter permease n=1 Tax=Paenibacillus endoradicis TaxID=2972487 RepID=UPI002159A3FD|nr:AzlC family ABC transporter permease [Paenibacillus endoradicis]MCR8657581.1 AzlC family ABC transporter permease [Paenibacillus endoradicis]